MPPFTLTTKFDLSESVSSLQKCQGSSKVFLLGFVT
jgi:hypothetical protein